ncbi:MAG: SsrA-binding protein [Alphaproteobacteria bacterium]|nr:SsrA-binding protein [Alphaproteobacteria bacterium]
MSAAPDQYRVVAQNRRARFDYEIVEALEVGIILMGSEVKSLRVGTSSINEAFAGETDGEIFLFNANIPEYLQANRFNHEPKRPRNPSQALL